MKNSTREDECKTVFADIREGAFYPIFQPIYGLQRENQIGAEVLTRWNKPRCNEKSFRCIEEEAMPTFLLSGYLKSSLPVWESCLSLSVLFRLIFHRLIFQAYPFFLMRFRYLKHVSVLE